MTTEQQEATLQDQHRALVLGYADTLRIVEPADHAAIEEAARRLAERMAEGDWLGDRYRRRRYPVPDGAGGAVEIECDDVELIIVRLLASTGPHGEFEVTRDGDVHTGVRHGYQYAEDRVCVSGLCPVLDAAADVLLARTGDQGGPMRVHTTTRVVELGDGSKLADLVEPGAPARAPHRIRPGRD